MKLRRSSPEVGARCVNYARRDLCGGCPVMGIPTAMHKSLRTHCIRPGVPLNPEDACRLVTGFVEHYNTVRLHSAIGYITQPTNLPAKKRLSLPLATKNSSRPEKPAKLNLTKTTPTH